MRNQSLLPRARELRHCATSAEQQLWGVLSRRQRKGKKFRRQHVIGPYIVDFFAIECGIAIELDGDGHADLEQQKYDIERTHFLNAHGVTVLRFWNHEVFDKLDQVVARIDEVLEAQS